MLSREAVYEYQKIYEEEFGTEISYNEALKQGIKLLSLMRVIYRPIPTMQANKSKEYENDTIKQS